MANKKFFIVIVILGVILTVTTIISCNKDDENQTSEIITIEAKQEVPYIIYIDTDDLNNQIPEAISITNLSIPEEAILISHTINSDMSVVTIRIDIKEEYKSLYSFPEEFKNVFEIDIQDLESSLGDFLFDIINRLEWQATPSQTRYLETFLCTNIEGFDFQNADTVCIPVVFHILEGAEFQETFLNEIVSVINTAFLDSKIQFSLDSSNSFNIPGNTYNLININKIDDLPKEVDKLNIYISDYLGIGDGIDQKMQAQAHLPVFDVFTNAIFIRSIFIDHAEFPNQPLLCHEIGHTFSLYHTFETKSYMHNECDPAYIDDGIVGTIPQDSYIPPANSTCDDWNNSNYMTYSHLLGFANLCDYKFIEEQNKRMRLAAEHWYSEIFCEDGQSEIPTLSTKMVINITETTAASGGDITSDGGANITLRGVCWSTTPNPTTDNSSTNEGVGIGEFNSLMTGLVPNSQYYVRAYAINSEGTGYGDELSFITLPSTGDVFDGDVVLTNQDEIDSFGVNNYSAINGNLEIIYNSGTAITNINALSSISNVTGSVIIEYNPDLIDISGLYQLESAEFVRINENQTLTSINGFQNLNLTGGVFLIRQNNSVISINIMNGVTTPQTGLSIIANTSVESITAFNLVPSANLGIVIRTGSTTISTINGFSNLTTVGGSFNIRLMEGLTTVNAFQNLQMVTGTFWIDQLGISDANNFSNLIGVGSGSPDGFKVTNNTNLSDLCGFSNLINNGTINGIYQVLGNAYNPTIQDFNNGDCSQ